MKSEHIRQYPVKSPMDQENHQVTAVLFRPELADDEGFQRTLELTAIASVSRNPDWMQYHGRGKEKVIQNKIAAARLGALHAYVIDPGPDIPYLSKRHRDKDEAQIQTLTLNMLGEELEQDNSDITTSSVLALVGDGYSPPAAVVERAPGRSLREQYGMDKDSRNYYAIMDELNRIQREIDRVIGRFASRVLINDMRREYNEGANIFSGVKVTENKEYAEIFTLFDQPFTGFTAGLCRTALLDMARRRRGLRGMLDMASELV
ncbi:hypothetical protein [Candidatus Nanosynbacter featherlites]|uniref:Uncharacterized protein n=1 Tax=Candidatus Nanosynbacter featherlites TaxID=2572088 RepID=A0A4P9A3D7_9BACT|nr:hypothetical protein [Candidatus Nanosynbacter featherlites]QCT42302.1 hypothetical protein FBF37_02370 [Candidatus Nanosynbacter featherlites]